MTSICLNESPEPGALSKICPARASARPAHAGPGPSSGRRQLRRATGELSTARRRLFSREPKSSIFQTSETLGAASETDVSPPAPGKVGAYYVCTPCPSSARIGFFPGFPMLTGLSTGPGAGFLAMPPEKAMPWEAGPPPPPMKPRSAAALGVERWSSRPPPARGRRRPASGDP